MKQSLGTLHNHDDNQTPSDNADNCLATPWQGVQLLTLKSTQGVAAPVDRRMWAISEHPNVS